MGRLLDLIIAVIVIAVCWWAFTSILAVIPIAAWLKQVVYVLGVLITVFAVIDYFKNGVWWKR